MEAGILSDATDLHASIRAPRSTVAAICVTLLMCSHFVEAQIAPETENQTVPDQVEAPSPGETIAVQKKQLAGELDAAQKALDRATAEGQDPPPSLQQTVDLLTRIELLLKQQAATVDHKAQLAQLMKEQENSLFELRHPRTADLKAYTFAQLETARDDLSKLAASAQTGAAELKKATENLSRAQDVYKVSESARRQAKERVDLNKDAAKQTDLAFAFIVARLSSRIAREQVDLAEFDLANEKVQRAYEHLTLQYLEEKVAAISRETTFEKSDLDHKLARIREAENDLKQQEKNPSYDIAYIQRNLDSAKQAINDATDTDPARAEVVAAWQLARTAHREEVDLIAKHRERLATMRDVWKHRHDLVQRTFDRKQLADWVERTDSTVKDLEVDISLQRDRLDELKGELRTIVGKIDSADEGAADVHYWLSEQRKHGQALVAAHDAELARLLEYQKLEERFWTELEAEYGTITFGKVARRIWDSIVAAWLHELGQVDDKPIRVKTVVNGIILLVVGYILSRYMSSLFGHRILPRFGVNRSGAAALQTVLFYILLVVFTLVALNIVNVPLTWFTLLGGAVAIGVGFGSQNIANNFISGIILLIERPVKVGDMIQLDDLYGNIVQIGMRSTRVKTGSNLEIIVPNSSFLENNVTNWTLSDATLRAHVPVGVVYGSPVQEVTRLLKLAANEHPKVFQHPNPFVLFTGFGDNSLNFEVHFWIRVQYYIEWQKILSEMRYAIDQLFRAAGIVIAFPQRDVHLDASQPIPVRVIEPTAQSDQPALTDIATQQKERAWLLGRVELFASMRSDEVIRLASVLEQRAFAAGRDIVVQGEAGSSLFVVVDGVLEVNVKSNGTNTRVGQVQAGECFGEMSLLTGEPRSVTVTAITDTTVFELNHDMLAPILQRRPEVCQRLSQILAERQARTDERLRPPDDPSPEPDLGFASDVRRRINLFFGIEN